MSERQRRGGREGGGRLKGAFSARCGRPERGGIRRTGRRGCGGSGDSRRRRRRGGCKLASGAERGSERSQNASGERGPAGEAG